jgi:hypothetical protein
MASFENMCLNCRRNLWLAALALMLIPSLKGQSGISTEGPLTVLRPGGGEPLVTLTIPFDKPSTDAAPVLQFEFGFATDEPDLPDIFFDSFSVTVQGDNPNESALLLTADRSGVEWAPENAGGVTISSNDVKHTEAQFANVDPKLPLKVAYLVTFALPRAFLDGPLKVLFDLFDNLNSAASVAYVQNVRVEAESAIKLQSSGLPQGPYADETSALLDQLKQNFSLTTPSGRRFFRIVAGRTVRISKISPITTGLNIEYQFVTVRLQSASDIKGPYTDETSAILNELGRTLTLTRPSANRFYRVGADIKSRLKTPRKTADQLELEYEFNP